MAEVNIQVFRLLLGDQKQVPLDLEVAKSVIENGLHSLARTNPSTYAVVNLNLSQYKLDYWNVDCAPEYLPRLAEIYSQARHTAGLSYSDVSFTVPDPESRWMHQVVIQIPVGEGLIELTEELGINQAILKAQHSDQHSLGWATADIRQALGGYSGRRLGVLMAGSPGWNSPQHQHNTRRFRSKNEGLLPSTLNDANIVFHLIHGLAPTNFLSGAVLAGLIKSKTALIDLLTFLQTRNWDLAKRHVLPQEDVEGVLYINSEVPGHAVKGGVVWDSFIRPKPDGGSQFGPLMGRIIGTSFSAIVEIACRRLFPLSAAPSLWTTERFPEIYTPYVPETFNTNYAVFYYSGHGLPTGQIQIEKDCGISPSDLCSVCVTHNLPILLILDMCHAAEFGHKFTEEMKKAGIPSVVMCSTSDEEACESEYCNNILKFNWPVDIQGTSKEFGTGVYTTALSFGLLCIRELEMQLGSIIKVSIQDFNDLILQPVCKMICKMMADYYNCNIRPQRPVVYTS